MWGKMCSNSPQSQLYQEPENAATRPSAIGRAYKFCHQTDLGSQGRFIHGPLGHTKMDSTVRYLGVELEDALAIAEAIEI